jgi:RHS repeat-associated protein
MAGTEKQPLVAPLQTIGKNGFLYVYVSNESPQDVYFDDLTVKHFTGPLQQEQSFYPFGLQMAAISSKALLKTNVPFKYNAGNELEEEGSLNYYNTFYRKYDAQLGRFTGIDIRAEESYGMSVYNYGANNPVLYNDPMGDMYDIPRNPASFSNAGELLQYIIQNGIDGFEGSHEFLWWSFMDAGGTGSSTLSGFYYGDDFSVGTSKSGESGLYFSFNGFVRDATNNGFNNPSNTLNSFVLGTKFISLQNLWNGAMQYGENNRMAEEGWFSSQSYDVMDQHNYAAFKSRMYGGRPLQSGNDRKSYTESLASFKARYAREVDGRNFEMGFVGVMAGSGLVALAAPIVTTAVPIAYSSVINIVSGINESAFVFGANIYQNLNNIRYTLGTGMSMYFNSNTANHINLQKWAEGTFNPTNSEKLLQFRDNYQSIQHYFHFLPEMP